MQNHDSNLNLERLKTDAQIAARELKAKSDSDFFYYFNRRMKIGQYQYHLRMTIASTKHYGDRLAKDVPETQEMDVALRCNNLWLYKALHVPGSEGNDIREVLGIKALSDFGSYNATVIKRRYKEQAQRLGEEEQSSVGDKSTLNERSKIDIDHCARSKDSQCFRDVENNATKTLSELH